MTLELYECSGCGEQIQTSTGNTPECCQGCGNSSSFEFIEDVKE